MRPTEVTARQEAISSPSFPPSERRREMGRGARNDATDEAGRTVCCAGLRRPVVAGRRGWQVS